MIQYILSCIFWGLLIFHWVKLHTKTRSNIEKWALENEYSITELTFYPWRSYGFIAGGIHPANFRVSVKDSFGRDRRYSIAGGGLFWSKDGIDIKKLRG